MLMTYYFSRLTKLPLYQVLSPGGASGATSHGHFQLYLFHNISISWSSSVSFSITPRVHNLPISACILSSRIPASYLKCHMCNPDFITVFIAVTASSFFIYMTQLRVILYNLWQAVSPACVFGAAIHSSILTTTPDTFINAP